MKRTIVIAEAGVNHNGSKEIALKLIDAAADAGADYIKFQTFKTENLVSKKAKIAAYQNTDKISPGNERQFSLLKKLELPYEYYPELIRYSHKLGIKFLSTPFDEESLDFLLKMGIEVVKIPSGELTNLPYLRYVASSRKPVILSTGMSDLKEIGEALKIFESNKLSKKNITILHCNTEYPTPYEDVNLLAMITIKETYGVKVGYSDHTLGIEVPIAAVAMGAEVIEKHFTIDTEMEGPDHKASLNPEELKKMISAIRNVDIAMGTSVKRPSSSEIKNIYIARKSIHLKTGLKKGDIIAPAHLIMKRPGDGISPMQYDLVVGKKVKRDCLPDDKLSFDDLI